MWCPVLELAVSMSFSCFRNASSGQYPDAQGVQVFVARSEVNLWNLRLSLPWKTEIPFSFSPFPFLSPFNPFSILKPAWSLKTRYLMVQILSVASQCIQIKIQTPMSCCARYPAPCFFSLTSCYLLLLPGSCPLDLPSFCPTWQVLFPVGYLTHAVSSTCTGPPSALGLMASFQSFRPELKCHLLSGFSWPFCSPQGLPEVPSPLHPPFLFPNT